MQHIKDRGHIPLDPLKVPGPSQYRNMPQHLGNVGNSFTMRRKLPALSKTMSIDPQNNNPGAGKYENPEAMTPRGNYSVGKHKGTGATMFNPKSSTRFFEFSTKAIIRKPQPRARQLRRNQQPE